MAAATIQNGDRVHDRDDPNPNDAIVVNQPPTTANEWEVQSRDCTLADDNPDYPADAAVVVICYVDDLRDYGPPFDPTEQTPLALSTLIESSVHFYTFPAPRLTVLKSPATGFGDTTQTETDDGELSTASIEPVDTSDLKPAITPVSNNETDTHTADESDNTDPAHRPNSSNSQPRLKQMA